MDATELANAYQRAINGPIWKAPNPQDAYPHHHPVTDVEVDYAIVRLSDSSYLVTRSRYLGSLDYEVVCNCESRHEAREIVRALNK